MSETSVSYNLLNYIPTLKAEVKEYSQSRTSTLDKRSTSSVEENDDDHEDVFNVILQRM